MPPTQSDVIEKTDQYWVNWMEKNPNTSYCVRATASHIECDPEKVGGVPVVIMATDKTSLNKWIGQIKIPERIPNFGLNKTPIGGFTNDILKLSFVEKQPVVEFNTTWYSNNAQNWITIKIFSTTNSIESKFPFIMLYTQNETPNLPIAQLSCHFGKFTATNPATFDTTIPCQRSGGHFQVLKFKNCGTNIITPDGKVRALFKQGRQYYVKQKINGKMAYVHVHKIK